MRIWLYRKLKAILPPRILERTPACSWWSRDRSWRRRMPWLPAARKQLIGTLKCRCVNIFRPQHSYVPHTTLLIIYIFHLCHSTINFRAYHAGLCWKSLHKAFRKGYAPEPAASYQWRRVASCTRYRFLRSTTRASIAPSICNLHAFC